MTERLLTRAVQLFLYGIFTIALIACDAPTTWKSIETGSGNVRLDGGATLFWRTLGNGADTVIVLHGGVGLHHAYLLDPFAQLATGRTLIFYDMRGRGRSSGIDDSTALTIEQDISDVDAVRLHFKLSGVTLVGHHWGAAVAALYAARHPDRVNRLLLISPFPVHHNVLYEMTFVTGDTAHYKRALHLAAMRSTPDTMAARCTETWSLFFAPWKTDTLTPYDRLAPAMCDAPPDRLARADWIRTQEQASLGSWVWRQQLNGVTAPALVIEGDGTPIVAEAATRWAQHLANARVLLLPPPYLFPWVGFPSGFRSAASEFLGGDFPARAMEPLPWRP